MTSRATNESLVAETLEGEVGKVSTEEEGAGQGPPGSSPASVREFFRSDSLDLMQAIGIPMEEIDEETISNKTHSAGIDPTTVATHPAAGIFGSNGSSSRGAYSKCSNFCRSSFRSNMSGISMMCDSVGSFSIPQSHDSLHLFEFVGLPGEVEEKTHFGGMLPDSASLGQSVSMDATSGVVVSSALSTLVDVTTRNSDPDLQLGSADQSMRSMDIDCIDECDTDLEELFDAAMETFTEEVHPLSTEQHAEGVFEYMNDCLDEEDMPDTNQQYTNNDVLCARGGEGTCGVGIHATIPMLDFF